MTEHVHQWVRSAAPVEGREDDYPYVQRTILACACGAVSDPTLAVGAHDPENIELSKLDKPTREQRRAEAQREYDHLSESATRGAGQTPYIKKKLDRLRATVNKLGGFK